MQRPLRAVTVFIVGLLALTILTGHAGAAERRVALVIGNSAYKNPALAIPNARNDAEDVASALTALGFDVLLLTDVDLAAAGKAIQQFARMSVGADSTLFYFAGHAVQYQGRNYLLPVDAEVKDEISLPFETIGVDNVRAVLDRSNGVKIMVLDACRTNPISDRLAALANSGPPVEPAGRTRGLERIDKSEGIIVAYATSPGDVALDGQERNSPFTKAFLRRLNEPGLEIEMMFRRIANDVRAATGGRQRPETYVSLVNEYVLNQSDRLAWDRIRGTDDPAELNDFLEHFPSSYYAIEARYRLRALERAIAEAKERALREAEVARREKELAAVEAAQRLKAEGACRNDRASLAAAGPRDADALRRLSLNACDEVKGVATKRLADLDALIAAEAEACRRDGAALAALGARDLDGLRALIQTASCADAKTAAAARIAGVETEIAKEAEVCRREDGELKELLARGDAAAVEAMRGRAQCPATPAAIAEGLRVVAAAAKAACDRDGTALQAVAPRDAAGLRAIAAKASCESVKAAAAARVADLDALVAREAAACRSEDAELKGLIERGDTAGIAALHGRAQCPATVAAADSGLRDLAAAADAACARDNAALNAIGPRDADALRSLADKTPCGAVKTAAAQRLHEVEAVLAHEADVCRRDEAKWKDLAKSGDRAGVEAFHRQAECASVAAAAERRLAELTTLCRNDDAMLGSIPQKDADALRGFLAKAQCGEVRTAAEQRLAALEASLAHEAEICRRDEAQWKDLAKSGDRAGLAAFRAQAECASVKTAAERRIAELGALCDRERTALGAIADRDAGGLRGFLAGSGCDETRAAAQQRLATLESALAHEAAICRRDEAKWKEASNGFDRAALTAMRQSVECPSVIAAIDQALGELKAACAREQAALAAIGPNDGQATKSFLAGAVCEESRTAAQAKLARIEADQAKQEETCRREDVELTALKTQGADARDRLIEMKQRLHCERLRPVLEAALEQIPAPPAANTREQLRRAQTQLQRLGCLAQADSGKLDARTREGLARYFEAKGEAAPSLADLKVTDEFVGKLEGEKPDLCAPAAVATPEPSDRKHVRPKEKTDVARLPKQEPKPAEPRPPREQAVRPPPVEKPARVARPRQPERPPPAPAQSSASRAPPPHAPSNNSALGVGF